MTATKVPANARPPMDRKITRKSEENRDEALDQGLRMSIGGEVFEARVGDVTPAIARELRKHTGNGFMNLVQTTADDPDIDVISAFVWVARRIAGEDVAFDDVQVSYAEMLSDDFDVTLPGAEDLGGDNPES